MAGAFRKIDGWLTPQMVVAFAIFGTLPYWISPIGLYQYLGVEVLIWCIFALGFNLLLGYTGLPSFGHGAFFGIGAYALGLTQFNLTENLWVGLAAATAIGALFGGAVACFLSHRRGIYFALMTIAFGQLFFFIASKWTSVTRGEDGLLNIKRLPVDLGVVSFSTTSNEAFYYFVFACFVVVTIFLWRLIHSPFGKVLQAIRQNETRTAFLGYNVFLYKWASFTLSCAISGLAGGSSPSQPAARTARPPASSATTTRQPRIRASAAGRIAADQPADDLRTLGVAVGSPLEVLGAALVVALPCQLGHAGGQRSDPGRRTVSREAGARGRGAGARQPDRAGAPRGGAAPPDPARRDQRPPAAPPR